MAKITIDGKAFEFDGKKMIIQVALENGVEIPHYCYHPGLSIVASCRICLAEVAQPNPRKDNQLELIPKLVPTCQTMAADGMEVYTQSPKSIANQKAVMEYLLVNHPLDCPVCDQAGECHLQDYSYRYGHAQSRFEEAKAKQPKKDVGPNVYLYSDRCIMCSRCVRFTREVTGTSELAIFGRGHKEQIDIFPGKPLDNELSGNVVDICPVGALLDKDFLFEQRVWFLTKTPSIDGITSSGDNITIEHNEGRVYRVKPLANTDVNPWWISDEIRYGWKFIHRDDRLRTPMRLQYGTQVESTWPHVYETARDNFKRIANERGQGSLAVMVSPMLSCEEAYLIGKLMRGLDPKATLAVGLIPVEGQDKTFQGELPGAGYTIRAEKCPNSRGVRRALESLGGDKVLAYEAFLKAISDKTTKTAAVLATGNYPSDWVTKDLTTALKGKYIALIDTLPNALSAKADLLLPGATWAEKAGTFENVAGRLQTFSPAIPIIESARSEGQIAIDLATACGLDDPAVYDAAKVRQEMGGLFMSDVHHPSDAAQKEPDMQYMEL